VAGVPLAFGGVWAVSAFSGSVGHGRVLRFSIPGPSRPPAQAPEMGVGGWRWSRRTKFGWVFCRVSYPDPPRIEKITGPPVGIVAAPSGLAGAGKHFGCGGIDSSIFFANFMTELFGADGSIEVLA